MLSLLESNVAWLHTVGLGYFNQTSKLPVPEILFTCRTAFTGSGLLSGFYVRQLC